MLDRFSFILLWKEAQMLAVKFVMKSWMLYMETNVAVAVGHREETKW